LVGTASPALGLVRSYIELTKPRILLLVLFTGLPVLWMAAAAPSVALTLAILGGTALAAGAANTLNC
jgi:protoheme IX farnesyltransferase